MEKQFGSEIRGFVFDVGGVFRDSSEALHFSFKAAFGAKGLSFPFSARETWLLEGFDEFNDFYQINRALLGALRANARVSRILEKTDPVAEMREIIGAHVSEKDEEMLREIEGITHRVFTTEATKMIRVFPGVKESINLLRSKKFKLGVVTVPKTDFSTKWLAEHIGDYFDLVLGGDKYKDKADGILRCCSAFSLEPQEVAMVGDTTTDIRNGKKAGAKTVALLCGMGAEKFLRKEKPDFVFSNVPQMAEHFCK